jgi:hypothetical protein
VITEIGIVAGEIWHILDETGGCPLSLLCARLGERPRDLILMSLGWLCREGHIQMVRQAKDYTIRLRHAG